MFVLLFLEIILVFDVYCAKTDLFVFPDDCPGTDSYREIPLKELNFITISVLKNGGIFTIHPLYNYYQMKELANDPDADFTKPTMMFVSGYLDQPNSPIETVMGSVYKQLGFTVLLLNARVFSNTDYVSASRNTRPVGKHTAEMLANLTSYGLDPKKFSLVGMSLGGQTISFIGKYFKQLTGMNISRITGLDPAGPCFRNLGPEDRLDQSDADFVDVVFTNIDAYGMAVPMGHVNFYVNGGEFQPDDIFFPCNALCSHLRSYIIWISALYYSNNFIAVKCESVKEARQKDCYYHKSKTTNVLGLNTDKDKGGIFYLATSNSFPYFLSV